MPPRAPSFHYAAFGLSCVYGLLVFCQLTTRTTAFASDLQAHVDFILHPAGNPAAGYSLLHQLCGWLLAWTGLSGINAQTFASGAMAALLVAVLHGSLHAVHAHFRRIYPERSEWHLAGCTLAAFLVSMIILFKDVRYLGVFTPNPWHNPTYSFGRYFSILAFFQFVNLLGPGERATAGRLAALAVFTALSAWGKPSFLIGFLPAAVGVLGWAWLRRWLEPGQALLRAAALLPGVLVLAWIDHKVFASATATDRVILAPGQGWGLYTPNFAMSIALGMLFPLYVLVARLRDLSRTMLTASLTWAASCGAFLLLAESGIRAGHANFAWCYMSGMFFMHLAAIGEWFLRPPVGNPVLRWTGTVLFLMHLLSGLFYFLSLLGGAPYI